MCTPGLPARSMRSMRKQHFRLPPWRRKPTASETAPDIADGGSRKANFHNTMDRLLLSLIHI